eukprot:TRINITY_DN3330_c0_g1_i1.p1 TRINITY_DN3330_c0_g1~~TRINITY_DN3330_c0_g1_i1.p1  ORF type:complete len:446 (-),score=114.89 TRINITY_DN3330_c0_g1_i1:1071-2408(-)
MDVLKSVGQFRELLLKKKHKIADEIYMNAEKKNIDNAHQQIYSFFSSHGKLGSALAWITKRQLRHVLPGELFIAERGGLAGRLIVRAMESLPSRKFSNVLIETMMDDMDTATIKDMLSCLDLCKLYLRSVTDSAEACPLELREAMTCLARQTGLCLIRDIKNRAKARGVPVTDEDKARCREKAYLAMFVLFNRNVIFPAVKAAAAKNPLPIEKNVIEFFYSFVEFIATDDIDSLKPLFGKSKDSAGFEKLARSYGEKWKPRILAAMVEYTDLGSLRAQRAVANRSAKAHIGIREEMMASSLAALFETSHTFRLCTFTQALPPKPVMQLRQQLLAQRRAELEKSSRSSRSDRSEDSEVSSSMSRSGRGKHRGKSSSSLTASTTSTSESSMADLDPFEGEEEDPDLALGRSVAPIADLKLKNESKETTIGDVMGEGLVVVALLRQFG